MRRLNSILLIAFAFSLSSFANTFLVPSQYTTINSAIQAASDGDTVLVSPGTYIEEVMIESVTIHLLSTNGPDFTQIYRNLSSNAAAKQVWTDSPLFLNTLCVIGKLDKYRSYC